MPILEWRSANLLQLGLTVKLKCFLIGKLIKRNQTKVFCGFLTFGIGLLNDSYETLKYLKKNYDTLHDLNDDKKKSKYSWYSQSM